MFRWHELKRFGLMYADEYDNEIRADYLTEKLCQEYDQFLNSARTTGAKFDEIGWAMTLSEIRRESETSFEYVCADPLSSINYLISRWLGAV